MDWKIASLVVVSLAGVVLLVGACGTADDDNVGGPQGIEIPPSDSGAPLDVSVNDSPAGGEGTIDAKISRYDFAFDLTTARARTKLTFGDVRASGGRCVRAPSRLAAFEEVTWNGAAAFSANVSNDVLEVCGTEPFQSGALEISARANVPTRRLFGLDVGFSRKLDLADGEFTYLLSWIGGCDLFGPCDHDPSRIVDMRFDITHPADSVVLCPGTLTIGPTKTDGTSSTHCEVKGAPTYSGFGFAADAKWKRSLFTQGSGVDVVMYEVPGGQLASSLSPASVQAFLAWITELLGPLPYGPELRVAGAPTAWLGFEHPANIILREDLPSVGANQVDSLMHVLMHEIAHQWAGNRTTLNQATDFVWKEATAEYLAYVFEDEKRPPAESRATRIYWDVGALYADHYPHPLDKGLQVHQFYGDVYAAGPMVLYVQLESMLGRPTILAAIKSFLSNAGARSVDDLRVALETSSGKDLKAYFDTWITGEGKPEWPTFSTSTAASGGDQLTITVTQQNASGRIYGSQVELEIVGPATTKRAIIDYGLKPTAASASTTITFAGAVTKIVLDPDHKLIARAAQGTEEAAASQITPFPIWIF